MIDLHAHILPGVDDGARRYSGFTGNGSYGCRQRSRALWWQLHTAIRPGRFENFQFRETAMTDLESPESMRIRQNHIPLRILEWNGDFCVGRHWKIK